MNLHGPRGPPGSEPGAATSYATRARCGRRYYGRRDRTGQSCRHAPCRPVGLPTHRVRVPVDSRRCLPRTRTWIVLDQNQVGLPFPLAGNDRSPRLLPPLPPTWPSRPGVGRVEYEAPTSGRRDLNPPHPPRQGGALPDELLPQAGRRSNAGRYNPPPSPVRGRASHLPATTRGPSPYQGDALPAELRRRIFLSVLLRGQESNLRLYRAPKARRPYQQTTPECLEVCRSTELAGRWPPGEVREFHRLRPSR